MKQTYMAILFAMLSLQAYKVNAKNDSTSVIKNGIGLNVAPIFSMPTYVNQNNYTNYTTKGGIGATAALCENIVLSKKQNFYLYAELGYQLNTYITQYPSFGVNTTNNTLSAKITDSYSNVYFSLSIQKVLFKISNKLGIFLGVGAQASNCFAVSQTTLFTNVVNGQTNTSTQTNTSYDIPKDNQFSAAALARLGFVITPVKHFSMNIAPIFYYGLNPNLVFKNNQPGYNSLGLNLQFMYNF